MEQQLVQGDDQQESLLWWLGGIIDGEGTISIKIQRHNWAKISKLHLHFVPYITITNTNQKIIETCQKILENYQIPYYLNSRSNKKAGKLKQWDIKIEGYKRVARALPILMKTIIAQKEQAALVKRFVDSRLERTREFRRQFQFCKNGIKDSEHKKTGGIPAYNDEELEIIKKIKEIHNRNPQRLYAEIEQYKKDLEKAAQYDKVQPYKKL